MNLLSLFEKITTFIFDVDGVLTDGTVWVLRDGLQARRMHIRDGLALQMALRHGYRVKIISGGNSPEVMDRLQRLGVTDINMSVLDKRTLVETYLRDLGIEPQQALYMGDDLPDVAPLQAVGLAVCPADAVPEVKAVCQYISTLAGGDACVRDVIEKTLRVQGRWDYDGSLASR